MSFIVGDRLPHATLIAMADGTPGQVELDQFLAGRSVVLFGLPGAYTDTCSTIHLPSFIRTADAFRATGIDEIACLAVNDPFVLDVWGKSSGAADAGIAMLADAGADFTNAIGMAFTAPPVGLYNRSNRYALILEDGVIAVANVDAPNTCNLSVGEELLAAWDSHRE